MFSFICFFVKNATFALNYADVNLQKSIILF